MSHSVLVGYATNYGSTQEVAEVVAAALREKGITADVKPLRSVKTLEEYGPVVIGAPLYMMHWHKDALNFLSRQQKTLSQRQVAIFALGPMNNVVKEFQEARGQLDKELAKFPWLKPAAIEIFGGKYDPDKPRFPMSLFAHQIPASDIRDWAAIKAWAAGLVEILHL